MDKELNKESGQLSVWNVALCGPPYRVFTYVSPSYLPLEAWATGQRVLIPVGRKIRMGVIMGPASADEEAGRSLKTMFWPLDQELLLSADVLELVRHLAKRQMAAEGIVLSSVLPKVLRTLPARFTLKDGPVTRGFTLMQMAHFSTEELTRLGQAWVGGRLRLDPIARRKHHDEIYSLLRDPPWGLRPRAKRQQAILEYLFLHGNASLRDIAQGMHQFQPLRESDGHADLSAKVLRQSLNDADAQRAFLGKVQQELKRALTELVRKGLVQAVLVLPGETRDLARQESEVSCAGFLDDTIPTDEQSEVLSSLRQDLRDVVGRECPNSDQGITCQTEMRVRLVHGVTGSGKTLLYLRLAREALELGRSVLLLAPEVALSAQLWNEVKRCFPQVPRHWYHGSLAANAKLEVFRALRRQATPQIVVGTRSALFLPFSKLGLIVVDEEHDASYKQDEGFNYQAKEVAFFRIKQHGGLLLLGSATPDIKSFHAADLGEIGRHSLRHRVSRRPLPEIQLVDMRQEPRSIPLSSVCRSELEGVLGRGEQAMFLLNRRGFAPLVSCLECGTSPQCPRCEVGLTYHKGWERLLCHYCGFAQPFPLGCAQCGGTRFLPLGEGTEGLEEYLENLGASGQGIVRLDRDSTRRKGSLEQILGDFAQGSAQVMVGTQMLSKGHHFPNVTMVVAVDGDVGLNLPDYRAAEKTFQLLVQLAGRAGRGDRPGRVLIQTRNPEHPCWEHIRTGDYEGFFTQELERRRKFAYPPFVKLAMIRLSYPREWEKGEAMVAAVGDHLRLEGERLGLRVLGPVPAPLGLLNGRKRHQCLLKAMSWQNLRQVFAAMRSTLPASSPLRVTLDLDPVNML